MGNVRLILLRSRRRVRRRLRDTSKLLRIVIFNGYSRRTTNKCKRKTSKKPPKQPQNDFLKNFYHHQTTKNPHPNIHHFDSILSIPNDRSTFLKISLIRSQLTTPACPSKTCSFLSSQSLRSMDSVWGNLKGFYYSIYWWILRYSICQRNFWREDCFWESCWSSSSRCWQLDYQVSGCYSVI